MERDFDLEVEKSNVNIPAAIAEFHSLVDTGRSTRRNISTESILVGGNLSLNSRVAAGIKDLTSMHLEDSSRGELGQLSSLEHEGRNKTSGKVKEFFGVGSIKQRNAKNSCDWHHYRKT